MVVITSERMMIDQGPTPPYHQLGNIIKSNKGKSETHVLEPGDMIHIAPREETDKSNRE